MNRRVLIYHPTKGIYLGSIVGRVAWSNIDPSSYNCAMTFESVGEGIQHILTWDKEDDPNPKHYKFIPIEISDEIWASIEEIQKLGLKTWEVMM